MGRQNDDSTTKPADLSYCYNVVVCTEVSSISLKTWSTNNVRQVPTLAVNLKIT